ncbi:MAG TPA: tryptophan 2,3-dioxygenase family protein [Thermoanaerobaculia bacterium]|nr:tryptophan 2,3-dioxygenase family protein [Thermoanaerobaculia bacterium]
MVHTYSNYLRLEELLNLQTTASGKAGEEEHDEMLFIVIHQVYELWFKQVLHETQLLVRSLEHKDGRPMAFATFKRILTIFKTLVAQVDILETMTPVSFASFRSRLDSASGFQSAQFRQIEFALGHKVRSSYHQMPEGSNERRLLEELMGRRSVYDAFLLNLKLHGYDIPKELLERDFSEPAPEDERVREILIRIYHTDPSGRDLCERMVDVDEALQEWRYRHVKMVQRTIGTKMGTGGSAGAEYLKNTLFKPLFPDLWTIRTEL